MARPAAEIEPNLRIFSKSRILPGPIRPSASRSMRTLNLGRDVVAGFCMEVLLFVPRQQFATRDPCEQGISRRSRHGAQTIDDESLPICGVEISSARSL